MTITAETYYVVRDTLKVAITHGSEACEWYDDIDEAVNTCGKGLPIVKVTDLDTFERIRFGD